MNRKLDQMVDTQLVRRGIRSSNVLAAMRKVDRADFLCDSEKRFAYNDEPQPIGFGQTISQPFIVALMTEMLELNSDDIVLEVGVGSGYQTAILLELVSKVYGAERIHALSLRAAKILLENYKGRFHIATADGTLGFPLQNKIFINFFDACLVAAAAPQIPSALISQLKPEGRMIIPVGDRYSQELVLVRKLKDGRIDKSYVDAVRFVPLVGKEGFH